MLDRDCPSFKFWPHFVFEFDTLPSSENTPSCLQKQKPSHVVPKLDLLQSFAASRNAVHRSNAQECSKNKSNLVLAMQTILVLQSGPCTLYSFSTPYKTSSGTQSNTFSKSTKHQLGKLQWTLKQSMDSVELVQCFETRMEPALFLSSSPVPSKRLYQGGWGVWSN